MKKLMILVLVLGISGLASAADWTAYNDFNPATSSGNVTNIDYDIALTGELMKYADNSGTGVTLTISGGYNYGGCGMPPSGTDVYNAFNGIIDMSGTGCADSGNITISFTGLDNTKTYDIVFGGSLRGGKPAGERVNDYELTGAVSSTYACSAGATKISETKVAIDAGQQDINGYVAAWTGITVDDGAFEIVINKNPEASSNYIYGAAGMMLTQIPEPATMLILGLGGLFLRRRK